MASNFLVTITGRKQGKFKGTSARKGQTDKIDGLGFSYGITSPRDSATGLASGKRQHQPVMFVKAWDAATPQIFTAVVTNEALTTVVFEFFHSNPDGSEAVFQTITLTNATISGFRDYTQETPKGDVQDLEEVTLTFQKIVLENKIGKTMGTDDWAGVV